MSLEINQWYVNEIKNQIVGFDSFDIDKAHRIREYARKAKAIKLKDRLIKRSLVKKFKIKFL